MSKTVAEVVVETLEAAGVKHCWGVPGDTLNYVTDAIRRSKIDWVHVRHEEAGGFAAGAEALLTGDLTAWGAFRLHPYQWFIRADDAAARALFGIIERRQPTTEGR